MTGPSVVMQRLRRAWDQYQMSEGFAAVICVLIWFAIDLLPGIIFERLTGENIGVILW